MSADPAPGMRDILVGYLPEKCSRRIAERLCREAAAEQGVQLPAPPVARYWCRSAPEGADGAFVLGFTAYIEPRGL